MTVVRIHWEADEANADLPSSGLDVAVIVCVNCSAHRVTYLMSTVFTAARQQCLASALTIRSLITGPPNGPVLFCWLSSVVVVVCNAAGRRAGSVETRRGNAAGGRAGRLPGPWTVGRPTLQLHGGPVVLRPVRVTHCLSIFVPLVWSGP